MSDDIDTVWVKIIESGKVVELGRAGANSMISSGFAIPADKPTPKKSGTKSNHG